ncbi:MAG: LysM peptidoglycan-binding domain-containing protein [Desulfobacterales bacterium]
MNDKTIYRVSLSIAILFAVILLPFLTSADESQSVVKYESGFYYTVEKGDTLWKISDRFFGSPLLWPDLWSENKQIKNPYQIRPGERIRLFHHTGEKNLSTKEMREKVFPKKEGAYYYYPGIDAVGFVRQVPLKPWGSIFKAVDNKKIIVQGDRVFIWQAEDGSMSTGEKYTVFRTLQPSRDKKKGGNFGSQHYLTGIVEIIESNPSFALARVIQSFRAIEINDLVAPLKKRSSKIPLTDSMEGLYGNVIVSEEHKVDFGDHSIAFIDKGDKDGVRPGQLYHIFEQETGIDPKTNLEVSLTPLDFGSMLVLFTEKAVATVLIIQSDKSVYSGAKFRSPLQ